ncbi:MAG: DUF1501 domain-containing protein [Armatimonadota bacterium]|nr:DUF1501 domain-containing protein [Armatimonadota bacterium]
MKPNWCGCDGYGNLEAKADHSSPHPLTPAPCHPLTLSRRQSLLGAGLATVAWLTRGATALADLAVNPHEREPEHDVLVTIFLRGGADGLNIIVPYGEDAYHRNRQTIGIAAPQDRRQGAANRALDLDGFFGFHPALAPLYPLYKKGLLACVHAVGSGDQTRSHFEAMSAMERGLPDDRIGTVSGWLARHLSSTHGDNASPLRAVALSSTMPDSLRGATEATALNSLAEFRLLLPDSVGKERSAELRQALGEFYKDGKDAVAAAGRETLAVLEALNRIDPANYRPTNGAIYPGSELGNGLRQVACLIKGRVGLEVACLDHRGPRLWDTHVAQGGVFTVQVDDLAKCLAAFAADMGREMNRVTVVVMTEFGRRVQENSGLGTDHGRASMMMLMGGGIVGGKVFAKWPGLEDDDLEPPGDLRVTTDYRDVLAEIVSRRLHHENLSAVFPNYTPRFLGVVKA